MASALLQIQDLKVEYHTEDGIVTAVDNLNLELNKGETLGLVGETGAGKTTSALAVMRLVPSPPGKVISGRVIFDGKDLSTLKAEEMRLIRGNRISMIFQDPMTSLNPVMTVGRQIEEAVELHQKMDSKAAKARAGEMLKLVGIPAARAADYPHEFSGGMRQRVGIAMALSCNPELLIADEPTTALDVTIQAQVLDLMKRLRTEFGTSMILITHDLGIVAEACDKVAIMYAGAVVEYGTVESVFNKPLHPYTRGLFGSIPNIAEDVERLTPIPGLMPDPTDLPYGCRFHPRCPMAREICSTQTPALSVPEDGRTVACMIYEGLVPGYSGEENV
ncbi:MAG: ABC transporter ATP-binding protein [Spirochaetaceae bacterium]|nr:MAG: ABC transporter ATP-binding protein [Spirochaetaceae bacterium]